jgi:uncharacterized protein YqeY
MTFIERVSHDLTEAMKSKNELDLAVLRLMRTNLKNKEIEVMHPLNDEECLTVVRTMVKQGRDALADFTSAGRQDLIDRQTGEIAVLDRYLPPAMPQEELELICKQTIAELGASSASDAGKVMGAVMKVVAGRADGAAVRTIVQGLLSAKQ